MDGKLRMFLILVGIGFASSVLLSLIPLGQFATCAENGIVPDLGSDAPKCVGFGVPNAFGDESEIKLGEPDYQFIDFSYQNKVGEPIKFVLEMRTSNNCNSYDAKVIHENGTVIWGEGADVSCAQNDNSEPIISQIKIGYNEKHPLIINESARYLIKITLDHGIIEREFIVRHTISGISLDRTVYPVIPDAPLKQYDSGIPFHEVQCKGGLQKTQRYDGSPACVNPDTYWELIKRDWVSEIIKAVQSRDVYSLHSSYMGNVIPTLDDFRNTLQESADIDVIFSKFGDPHDDIGSGIHIYEYVLNDFTKVWIGYADVIQYVRHVDADGNTLEEIYVNLIKEPKSEPHPEPAPLPEEEPLQKQRKHDAKIRTQETIMMDFRGNQHQIDAINQYRGEFESGYFLEQFVIPTNQNFEEGQVINFIVGQWGYQSEECTSYRITGYFKSYSDYENPFNIEKIFEWENTEECFHIISSDSNGYLIVNLKSGIGLPEEHQTCVNPGEYRIHVRNLENTPHVESGYYTCQRDKLMGEPQPWMQLPE